MDDGDTVIVKQSGISERQIEIQNSGQSTPIKTKVYIKRSNILLVFFPQRGPLYPVWQMHVGFLLTGLQIPPFRQ